MLAPLLPQPADNVYRGHKLGIVLFSLLLFMKTAISLGSIFNGRTAASSADGIPIDTYTPASAQAVVSLFGILGLSNFLICLIGGVVLFRYRSLVPAMFALFLVHELSKKLILNVMPIARVGGASASILGLVILSLIALGLALSLWSRQNPRSISTANA